MVNLVVKVLRTVCIQAQLQPTLNLHACHPRGFLKHLGIEFGGEAEVCYAHVAVCRNTPHNLLCVKVGHMTLPIRDPSNLLKCQYLVNKRSI